MKKFFAILCLILSIQSVKAEWVNIEPPEKPIKVLDTDNIYKLKNNNKEGVVFAVRFLNVYSKEKVATFFADFKNEKAGVIALSDYTENMTYNFLLKDDINMKEISSYKTDYKKVKEYFTEESLKECPEKFLSGKTLASGKNFANEMMIFKDYLKNAEIKARKNWNPPKLKSSDTAIVRFKITKEGKIEDLHLTKMTKNEMFNEACLKAVKLAEPFGPFPKEYTKDTVEMELRFDYNILSNQGFDDLVKKRLKRQFSGFDFP